MVPTGTIPITEKRLPAGLGKLWKAGSSAIHAQHVKLPDVCSKVVLMGLLEQNTLGNIQGADKAQLQELFT